MGRLTLGRFSDQATLTFRRLAFYVSGSEITILNLED